MENNLPAALLPNLPASTPGASLPWDAGGGGVPPNTYYVTDFSDANYYQATAAGGITGLGTLRLIGRLKAVPDAVRTNVIAQFGVGGTGYVIGTGATAGAINAYQTFTGGAGAVSSDDYIFAAGDVGKLFVLHATGDGSALRLFVGGSEAGNGNTMGTVTAPGADARLTVGRYQHGTGYSNPYIDIVAFHLTETTMTPAQIYADALAIQSRAGHLVFPALPGEVSRFNARSLKTASTAWADEGSNALSLTRNGTPTLAGPL